MPSRVVCALAIAMAYCSLATVAKAQPLLGPPGALIEPPPQSNNPPAAAETPTVDESLPVPPGAALIDSPSTQAPDLKNLLPRDKSDWYAPTYWIGPAPWETSIEFGLNGSSGTSESLSIQAGSTVLRESRFSKLNLETEYNRTTKSGAATQDNAELDVRNDWLLHEKSPWTLYTTGNVFYDEFQAFDLQANANAGVGYRFFHKPTLELLGRFGGGASREFGGPNDKWVPESLLAVEYMQRLTALQKLTAKVDYYPEWEEVGEFRLLADIAWETALVQPSNMSLKVSASDRYDSTPGGADPHLVNYSVLLMIKM